MSNKPEAGKFQSETGRGIDGLVTSSPLFYTVSGSQGEKQTPRYQELLGSPDILKPNFRDLTGSTRLSVGVPSTPYRQFPLDKLNKTMGKSPNMQSKRYARGSEKYASPIKVNAKIRHIYSQITTTPTSIPHSSYITLSQGIPRSTQTEPFQNANISKDCTTNDGEVTDECSFVEKRDAATCMSPREVSSGLELPLSFPNNESIYPPIPASYAGKLEDLEKITGHIVIQRFFTRADEAFGFWLEKQLGRNCKSVGVDTSDTDCNQINQVDREEAFDKDKEKDLEIAQILCSTDLDNLIPEPCAENDFVQCECFLDKIKSNDLSTAEFELVSQCIEYAIQNVKSPDLLAENEASRAVSNANNVDEINNAEETDKLRFDLKDSNDPIMEELISKTVIANLEGESTLPNSETLCKELSQESSEDTNKKSESEDTTIVEKVSESDGGTNSTFDLPTYQCIPDIIDVTNFIGQETVFLTNESQSHNLTELNSNTLALKPAELKVAEYLADLERSVSVDSALHPEASCSSRLGVRVKEANEIADNVELKRSMSIDSCIGTESSGETRNALNESTPLDSSRFEANEQEKEATSSDQNYLQSIQIEKNNEPIPNTSLEQHNSQDHEIVTNKSLDESTRSEQSSEIKHCSEDEDADQSESDSDISSLRRPAAYGLSLQDLDEGKDEDVENFVLQDDDDDDIDEPDQFDAMIESHKEDKRSRPICRKRNVSTQTSQSVEGSSAQSSSAVSRSTTATSNSSYDLEFVSKSKKLVSHISSGNNSIVSEKRRSYLPSGGSSLNVLNMKFTMGKEFESEVSIRIPPQSPSSTSQKFNNGPSIHVNNSGIVSTSGRLEKFSRNSLSLPKLSEEDTDLKNLWKDVKSRMDSRIGESRLSQGNLDELQVRGNRLKLISLESEVYPNQDSSRSIGESSVVVTSRIADDERIKRSLKRLKKILDD